MNLSYIFLILVIRHHSIQAYYSERERAYRPEDLVIKSSKPYDGGIAKEFVKILAPNQQHHIKHNYNSPIPHIFPWKQFNTFFSAGKDGHLDNRIDYNSSFAMQPRPSGAFHWVEKSSWYQQLAGYCVNGDHDSYSYVGLLCTGITDFGINVFIETIFIQDLMICAMIAFTTGDSLFCLAWYLTRFFFNDYLPVILKEELDYQDGRLRQAYHL